MKKCPNLGIFSYMLRGSEQIYLFTSRIANRSHVSVATETDEVGSRVYMSGGEYKTRDKFESRRKAGCLELQGARPYRMCSDTFGRGAMFYQ